ncbi:MAG: hypothetical protein CMN21_13765, partial [Rubinisphaera sp.]|uniref:hypothetical protein n=1 Tax=Rubinisphaera sp. TaxID=2024857 RepID=UPI000C0F2F95
DDFNWKCFQGWDEVFRNRRALIEINFEQLTEGFSWISRVGRELYRTRESLRREFRKIVPVAKFTSSSDGVSATTSCESWT